MSTGRIYCTSFALLVILLAGCSPQRPTETTPGKQAPKQNEPDAPKITEAESEAEAKAVEVVERAGGKVTRNGGRVVKIDLANLFNPLKFGDADVKQLVGLTHLRDLNLSYTQITDEGMKDVARIAGLKELGLGNVSITDASLKEIAKLKELEMLHLNGSGKVTDAGIHDLVALDNLQTLRISSTGVTDAGLKDLAKLKSLSTIFLVSCKVTADGINEFKAAKPKCTIIK